MMRIGFFGEILTFIDLWTTTTNLGGNLADTFFFNDAIGYLGLIELQLKGRAFTWSNMQQDPLMEQLDWFFTSPNWTVDYPDSEVLPLAKITSDDIPCKVSIGTRIPRSDIFRFENFWADYPEFLDTVLNCWLSSYPTSNMAKLVSAKFKKLRSTLKAWSKGLSNLSLLISNCNKVILFPMAWKIDGTSFILNATSGD